MAKKKVAILGGGCAAMSAAYYLSNTQALRDALDVTVYQIGWRLGGKGASGRDVRTGFGDRILEHGLHVWGGFYYNAFRMIRECYDALERPPDCPLRKWDDAFKKRPLVAWEELIDGGWKTWPLCTPIDDEIPGDGDVVPAPIDLFIRLIKMIIDAIVDWPHEGIRAAAKTPGVTHPHLRVLAQCAAVVEEVAAAVFDGSPLSALHTVHQLAQTMRAKDLNHSVHEQQTLVAALGLFHKWFREAHGDPGSLTDELRRLFIITDLGLTIGWGMFTDNVIRRGFMSIDGFDFRQWLRKHGAVDVVLDSAALRGYYDYFFAYQDGDSAKPRMSAGMGLAHMLRLVADYKGSLFWKMQSGMGDAVFAPLYEICRQNGVQFKFFHRVTSVVPAEDGKSIASVRINRQVDLVRDYDPLVHPRNVPSWPSEPRYEFIAPEQAEKLKADPQIDLEDPWTNWPFGTDVELEAGRDFDAVVLGLSIGAFPAVCKPIIDRDETWFVMVGQLPAIQTIALQIWFDKSVHDLGWNPDVECNRGAPESDNATGTGYANPLQSWSDMTPVIAVEQWPPQNEPKSVIYFCGPMPTPPMPSGVDPSFGEKQTEMAKANALAWAKANLTHLFPAFDWNSVFDPSGGSGEGRFAAQFVRANYAPTERYVLDLPGTNQYRLEADTSGYSNLALAGDWLFTGLGGAVESAVISGMQAARGLAGSISDAIAGETRSPWRRPVTLIPLIQ